MMNEKDPRNPALNRLQMSALVIGVVCAIAVLAGGLMDWPRFINAYLVSYLLVLGLALGSIGLVMMHHMTGGEYGYLTRRISEAAGMTMPLLTIGFIPIVIGARHLYPWANPDLVHGDHILQHQSGFMSWWIIRAIIYFAIWNFYAIALWWGSSRYDRTGNPWTVLRLQRISAIGLFIYAVSMSFASVDWIMLRELHWYSSILGFIICIGQMLGAIVLSVVILKALRHTPSIAQFMTPARLNDEGNLFLTFTILWTYLSFAQLLIIWMGNVDHETTWYVRRGLGGISSTHSYWTWVGLILIVLHFFVPFFVLLGRNNKRRIEKLAAISLLVLIMRPVDIFWWAGPTSLSIPSIQTDLNGLLIRRITWVDVVLLFAMFFIWLAIVLWLLKLRPALARTEHGPELEEGGAHHAHAAA